MRVAIAAASPALEAVVRGHIRSPPVSPAIRWSQRLIPILASFWTALKNAGGSGRPAAQPSSDQKAPG